jgi:anti-sigma regulatory factor (Ser/Thr protein kinase)
LKTTPTLTVPGELNFLAQIAEFVLHQAHVAELDKHCTYQLRLAVDEIATNVILHGYEEHGQSGDIVVSAECDDRSLTIVLEDTAPPYDPCQRDLARIEADFDKPIEDRQIGGLGVYFAVQAVDEFRYDYCNGRNRNIFKVHRRVPAVV